MAPASKLGDDLEAGRSPLLRPYNSEEAHRWAFIRKIYSIITVQLLATIAVSAAVVTVSPIADFFSSTTGGLCVYILILVIPFIVLCPLYSYRQRHPLNYLLLGIFTIALAFSVGLTCAYTSGKIILEAVILTAALVISLTLYTFWATWRGHDFSFLGPFLFGSLIILLVFGIIQVFFPLGKFSEMIYGFLGSIIFCGYIIYDTFNVIARYDYDDYIWAAVALYLDVLNLFLSLLNIFRASS